MLVAAAAEQWKVAPAQLRTEKGMVIGPAGQKASYGSLAEAAIRPVALAALEHAGSSPPRIVAGIAGALAAPEAARRLGEQLLTLPGIREVLIMSDALTTHAGAFDGAPGTLLAVGTGAVGLCIDAEENLRRADGAGPWLGDAGGGAWLGRAGLRAALRAAEGRGPATALLAAGTGLHGPVAGWPGLIEGAANPPRLLAGFAPSVDQAAGAGDPVALALVARAAQALAHTAQAVGRPGLPVCMVGGLTALPALMAALARLICLVAPVGTALDGARLLGTQDGLPHLRHAIRVTGLPRSGLDALATEAVQPGLEDLDRRSAGEVATVVVRAEARAHPALEAALPAIVAAADAIAARMRAGGRLFTLGAGTPGRLAMLDAAELGPTFGVSPGLVIPLLAGGPGAMLNAVEGAEDDAAAGAAALDAQGLVAGDAVLGIAASGRTPFVVGALRHARARGALTVAMANNAGGPAAAAAELAIPVLTGAEAIGGSTRLTAGTTQKIVLNALSTACMVALGKTYGARMVDVRASNDKLRRRALRMVCDITGAPEAAAADALAATGFRVKPALVVVLAGVDAAEADRRLDAAGGRVRDALKETALPGNLP